MAASGAPVRQPRRGPAPIASFDHDGSDESSPDTKQTFRLPEIVEDSSSAAGGDALAPPELRTRSHSTPCTGAGALGAPPAPRIDISRASSSSHQDSRDSSPELALFAGAAPTAAEGLGFREDGALDLRSSTEELAFLEPAPGERAPPPPAPPPARRHSRKDSQGSEAALLAVSGRTSRLSSVGSQCSAHSALSGFSRVSRLSVASGASRSPSPHRMLLETSFCGPKPIETDPEVCAAAVEERLLEMAKLSAATSPTAAPVAEPASAPPVAAVAAPAPVDARDRREVRTEATVERPAPRPSAPRSAPAPPPAPILAPPTVVVPASVIDDEKLLKETKNKVRAEERRARSRERRDDSGETRTKSRSKDIIRIRLKPSEEYDNDDDDDITECAPSGSALKPATLELGAGPRPARPTDFEAAAAAAPAPRRPARDSRTPSPAGAVVSRKSSFCSLFKSRETIASPESPSDALRRKKSLNEGRSRSRSRDRSATPTSATKIKGSVLSLFKTPRKSATSPTPSTREGSPVVQPQRQPPPQPPRPLKPSADKLKYYDDSKDGIIHIPLRTPPDEAGAPGSELDARPASAPQQRAPLSIVVTAGPSTSSGGPGIAGPSRSAQAARSPSKPIQRTVLPDGSIIIPLRSPTEKNVEDDPLSPPPVRSKTPEESRPVERTSRSSSTVEVASAVASPGPTSISSALASASPGDAAEPSETDVTPSPDPLPEVAPTERASSRRERLIFTTHVGSAEQVFCTQFSITKTPSVTSEISGSFASFPDPEEPPPPVGAFAPKASSAASPPAPSPAPPAEPPRSAPAPSPRGASPQEVGGRDSSESEASSEAAPARGGNDVERRGLVVQESFEDELPYVPTTLPQERSLALPMVPVRERADVRVAAVERPRAAAPRASPVPRPPPRGPLVPPVPPAPRAAPAEDKIRIKLPRRPRTASASTGPPRPERTRARSGSDGMETRPKAEWIDFEEVPERRKQPKRIQTLPSAAAAGAEPRDVVFSYVEPEECRCECHARADDETPLLLDETDPRLGTSPVEEAESAPGAARKPLARPFTGDLELHHHDHGTTQERASAGSSRQ